VFNLGPIFNKAVVMSLLEKKLKKFSAAGMFLFATANLGTKILFHNERA